MRLGCQVGVSVDPDKDADELAAQLRTRSPHAIALGNRLLHHTWNQSPRRAFWTEMGLGAQAALLLLQQLQFGGVDSGRLDLCPGQLDGWRVQGDRNEQRDHDRDERRDSRRRERNDIRNRR